MRTIFGAEMRLHEIELAARRDGVKVADVTTSAKGATRRGRQQNQTDMIIMPPLRKGIVNFMTHSGGQSVQGFWSVESDASGTVLNRYQQIFRILGHV